jgi:ATP-binding cassette subfamily B protein
VELAHRGRYGSGAVSRHVPASVTELAQVGLLAGLPGATLASLAQRMRRESVPSGAVLVAEGDPADRFYVLLSGVASVSQAQRGALRVLRPGEGFGEVALAMGIRRTATVTALTPCVVASCDAETFDELIRPLLADDD